jgi:integrase
VDSRCRRDHGPRVAHHRAVLLLCRLQWHSIDRPDELCRAEWGEVEGPAGVVSGWESRAQEDSAGHACGQIRVKGKTTHRTRRMRLVPITPTLTRALERLRSSGLHGRWIFPRLTRGGKGTGRWTVEALARPVRRWREAAGLLPGFVLYSFRHKGYTHSVGRGGQTADQAGQVGGTSGAVASRNYLQEDLPTLFDNFEVVRRAGRSGGR